MQVDHLVILAFPKQGPDADLETMAGARALFDKNQARHTLQTNRVITVWKNNYRRAGNLPNAFSSTAGQLDYECKLGTPLVNDKIGGAVANSLNVGVYVICHGHGRRPTVFGAQGSAMRLDGWAPPDIADAMALFFVHLGLRNIRKLCMLQCGTLAGADDLFVQYLATAIHARMGISPLLAGYDDYISVFSQPAGEDNITGPWHGRKKIKIANDEVPAGDHPAVNLSHKKFFVYNNGSVEPRNAGWSDKPAIAQLAQPPVLPVPQIPGYWTMTQDLLTQVWQNSGCTLL